MDAELTSKLKGVLEQHPGVVASDERLGEPETNRALFQLLSRAGVIPDRLAGRLVDMAGFRNVLVHGYDDVQVEIVEDVVRNHLGDLDEFVGAVKGYLDR